MVSKSNSPSNCIDSMGNVLVFFSIKRASYKHNSSSKDDSGIYSVHSFNCVKTAHRFCIALLELRRLLVLLVVMIHLATRCFPAVCSECQTINLGWVSLLRHSLLLCSFYLGPGCLARIVGRHKPDFFSI